MNYFYLLLTAAIWGFAFVAQREGMEHLDPLTFNALRFALGTLCVAFFRWWQRKHTGKAGNRQADTSQSKNGTRRFLLLGLLLFIAATFQQLGIVYTSAGNAGFITGLYVVFVPLIGIFRGQSLHRAMIAAILLSAAGLWLINRPGNLDATLGNLLVLVSAVVFAFHVQYIDKLTRVHNSLDLALWQYGIVTLLSLFAALIVYPFWRQAPLFPQAQLAGIKAAALPILYGGIMSVGVAYTLQLHAQKKVPPHPASLVLCLEAVFALLGGVLLLAEPLPVSIIAGAALLLSAMLISVVFSRQGS